MKQEDEKAATPNRHDYEQQVEQLKAERDEWHRRAFRLAHHLQSPVIEVTREEAKELALAIIRTRHPDALRQPKDSSPAAGVPQYPPGSAMADLCMRIHGHYSCKLPKNHGGDCVTHPQAHETGGPSGGRGADADGVCRSAVPSAKPVPEVSEPAGVSTGQSGSHVATGAGGSEPEGTKQCPTCRSIYRVMPRLIDVGERNAKECRDPWHTSEPPTPAEPDGAWVPELDQWVSWLPSGRRFQIRTQETLAMVRRNPANYRLIDPSPPPAVLPGGDGPTEALRRGIVEALRATREEVYAGPNHTAAFAFMLLADKLESGAKGRT